MHDIKEFCFLGVLAALVGGAGVSSLPFLGAVKKSKLSSQFAWLAVIFAFCSVLWVAFQGQFTMVAVGTSTHPEMGVLLNSFTVTLVLFICITGAVIQSFSVRYLQAEKKSSGFFTGANAVLLSMIIVATSITVTVLVIAWIFAGMSFVWVIRYRSDLPGTKESSRKTMKAFMLGDSALLVAAVMMFERMGNIDLASLGSHVLAKNSGVLSVIIALLIVIAALTRSAQGLFGNWLPGTISAPTPVSALLHAGVVNGGGILLIRLSFMTGNSIFAMAAAFVVVLFTATVANAVMTKKADVKGSLVFSTMAQMGFMIAECSVGLYLAALIHLIGHAMYKATLFFGSGSQILGSKMIPKLSPISAPLPVRMVTSVLTAAATVAIIVSLGGLVNRQGFPLIIFISITIASAVWTWWSRHRVSYILTLVWTLFFMLLGTIYGALIDGLGRWVTPSLPVTGSGTLDVWWLLGFGIVGIGISAVMRVPTLRTRTVVLLLDAGSASFALQAKRGMNTPPRIQKEKQDAGELISAYSGVTS